MHFKNISRSKSTFPPIWRKTPCHTKIIQKSKNKTRISVHSPKNHPYCSKYRFSVVPNIHRFFVRIHQFPLKNPSNLSRIQPISLKIPSNIAEIRVFHVKMIPFAFEDQQTQNLTKNEEYDGKQPHQPPRSRQRRARKRTQKRKRIFLL